MSVLIASVLLNTALFARADVSNRFHEIARGWIMGRRAGALFGVPWRELFDQPLSDVRRALGIDADAIDALVPSAAGWPTAELRFAA